jgi:spermidine/putrescine transport system substrate-binding protein
MSVWSNPASANGRTDDTLVMLTWPDYMDPALLEAFHQKHGVHVKEVLFNSDDDRDKIIAATNGVGFDIMIVNGGMLASYREQNWVAALPKTKPTHLSHRYNQFDTAFPKGVNYAVPVFWGTMGIAYRQDLVPYGIQSWTDLFKPARALQGKISLSNTSREVVGMALKSLGHSSSSRKAEHLEAVAQLLRQQNPHVYQYDYLSLDPNAGLLSGEVSAGMVYSGDAINMQDLNPHIRYVLPEEGGEIWVDYLVVFSASTKKDLAWKLINFLNEPRNMAQWALFTKSATPNIEAQQHLPADFLNHPAIYPNPKALANSEMVHPLPARVLNSFNAIFDPLPRLLTR